MKKSFLWSSLVLFFLVHIPGQAQSVREDGSRIWIPRPWEFRYVLIVDSPSQFQNKKERYQAGIQTGKMDITSVLPLFDDVRTIQIRPGPAMGSSEGAIGMLLIEFNQLGEVLTPHSGATGLKGHINRLGYLVLAAGNAATDRQFDLGEWYTGRSSEELIYTPAVCSSSDMRNRYVKGFIAEYGISGFGCREWGYYLKSEQHPYIDVTSYQKEMSTVLTGVDPVKNRYISFKTNTHILDFIGWGRFDIAAKPVIGNFENTWVCLHECPDGEAPGVIPDIKEWTKKRGWALPKRPKKQPMFPDVARKPGDFID
jgi:hypothetical protein